MTELYVDDSAEQLVFEDRVKGRVYTDPRIFEKEMDLIFHSSWIYVCHESEIPKAGDFKSTLLGSQPMIVVRDADGSTINVMYNRCRHRAATVCDDDCGTTRRFRCPYHGWTYGLDGHLEGVTFQKYYGDTFDKSRLGLLHVAAVDSYAGFVFASLRTPQRSLDEHLGNARPALDFIAQEPFELSSGLNRLDNHANWKLLVENTVDNYHTATIHRVYLDIVGERRGNRVSDLSSEEPWRTRDLGNGHAMLDFRSADLAIDLGGLPFNLLVFPNLAFVGTHLRVFKPLAVDRTLVEMYPMLPVGCSAEERNRRLDAHEDFMGPAGFGTPDDADVVFRRVPEGLKANLADDWVLFDRGWDSEQVEDDGTRSGHITGELTQRGFYRQWSSLMEGR